MWTELSDTAILKRLGTRLKAYRIASMRTLGLLENLDLLVPEQKPSPMELLKMQGKQVKRVRTKKD